MAAPVRSEDFSPAEVPATTSLIDKAAQLALYCYYELHYREFAGRSDEWEWEPALFEWAHGGKAAVATAEERIAVCVL